MIDVKLVVAMAKSESKKDKNKESESICEKCLLTYFLTDRQPRTSFLMFRLDRKQKEKSKESESNCGNG